METIRYRVKNMCAYDIGITLMNGQAPVIKAKSFLLLTADDIMYIDSIARRVKPFETRMLVAYDDQNEELALDKIGMYVDENVVKHYTDDEIRAILKGTATKIKTWVAEIDDPAELYNICKIAQEMDLPPSKTSILAEKNPDYDWGTLTGE